jgi:hypothetical protein
MVRSEGLEPPRFYSLPPQGSASTNSATSAWKVRSGPDQRRRCNKSGMEGQGPQAGRSDLSGARLPGLHLLDFDRDPVAVDQYHAAGDGQVIGEDLDLVGLGCVQFDDGATAEPHDLMDRH